MKKIPRWGWVLLGTLAVLGSATGGVSACSQLNAFDPVVGVGIAGAAGSAGAGGVSGGGAGGAG